VAEAPDVDRPGAMGVILLGELVYVLIWAGGPPPGQVEVSPRG